MKNFADVQEQATKLLQQIGAPEVIAIEPLPGGRNNRSYRVEHRDGAYVLKQYYRDSRNPSRFQAETQWLRFCQAHRIATVPRLLATDEEAHAALCEFIPGRRLAAGELCDEHVQQAMALVGAVNACRTTAAAQSLPLAAEAAFSLGEHVARVTCRLDRLRWIPLRDSIDRELRGWLEETLLPYWRGLQTDLARRASRGLSSCVLPHAQRRLSPSDFGFHNALLVSGGRLCFLDFEYAGWDDPAKLICDFYWQVEQPVPRDSLGNWIPLLADDADQASLRERVRSLFPVYGVKWCAILLNEFLPADGARRAFAATTAAVDFDARQHQFTQAQGLFDQLYRDAV